VNDGVRSVGELVASDDARDDVRRVPADVKRHRHVLVFSISGQRDANDSGVTWRSSTNVQRRKKTPLSHYWGKPKILSWSAMERDNTC